MSVQESRATCDTIGANMGPLLRFSAIGGPLGTTMRILCVLLSILMLFQQSCLAQVLPTTTLPTADTGDSPEVVQACQILGVQSQYEQLKSLYAMQDLSGPEGEEALELKSHILRQIMLSALEVRESCNKLDIELAYTYGVLYRAQSHVDMVNNLFNLANFCQFGVLYSIEGYSRLKKQFVQSGILTCVGAGVGTALPTANILYNKMFKARNVSPSKQFPFLNGGPVDAKGLPEHVSRFLDTPAPGASQTRREEMYALWKKRYGVDASNPLNLAAINDEKSKTMGELNKRILLLWSLHTYIQDFDLLLVSLLKKIKRDDLLIGTCTVPAGMSLNESVSPLAADAVKLMKIEPLTLELIHLNKTDPNNPRRRRLELCFLESVMLAGLDVRVACNKIDEELNYAHDVALSEMLRRRGKELQLNFEANFIHNGIFGGIAGLLYLKRYTKAGNEMFVISSGIGTVLSTLALLQMHGGWRKRDTPPNSLAALYNLETQSEYQFSPLVSSYLNSQDPLDSKIRTRRDELYDLWKKHKAATMNMKVKKNQEKVAAMPTIPRDTIRILRNRIALLTGLKAMLGRFDPEIFAALKSTDPNSRLVPIPDSGSEIAGIDPLAAEATQMLGLRDQVTTIKRLNGRVTYSTELSDARVSVMRHVLCGLCDIRATSSKLDVEIVTEKQALDHLVRNRDLAVAVTNNINFFQINVLGIIIDGPFGLTTYRKNDEYNKRTTIASGILAFCLAVAAFAEQRGGVRLMKVNPNSLGICFGLESEATKKFSPILYRFLNSTGPGSSQTRREILVDYWKRAKTIDFNINKVSNQQKLAATGPKHHFWQESIKVANSRLNMLYDLRAVVDFFDADLTALLRTIN